MNLVLISDTHAQHNKLTLPEGDVLVHAGDWTNAGSLKGCQDFAAWFKDQPYENKVCVAGNHDWAAQAFMTEGREDLLREIFYPAIYLRDTSVTIGGKNFYGSPWQPTFCNWAFNLDRGTKIKERWDLIPKGTDVLITHGPPFGLNDKVLPRFNSVGCSDLLDAAMRVSPKLHVFGHIHSGYGMTIFNEVTFANASVVDESYAVCNEPLIVEI